jgi:hypothetical protein
MALLAIILLASCHFLSTLSAEVHELNEENFEALTSSGSWFMKFYGSSSEFFIPIISS